MGKPYSMDLRERAVGAVLRGGLSRHKSAAQFGVGTVSARSSIGCRRFQDTGSVAPGQMGGHKPKAIAGEHQVFLARRVREGGFTLRGLVRELAERGLKVDYRSVWNFVHAERLSFKKKPSSPASAIDPTSRAGASSGRTGRAGSILSAWVFIDETWTKTNMAPLRGVGDARGEARGQGSLWPLENSDLPRRASPHDCIEERHGCSRWPDQRRRLRSPMSRKCWSPPSGQAIW